MRVLIAVHRKTRPFAQVVGLGASGVLECRDRRAEHRGFVPASGLLGADDGNIQKIPVVDPDCLDVNRLCVLAALIRKYPKRDESVAARALEH
jgi:hypothetical protein